MQGNREVVSSSGSAGNRAAYCWALHNVSRGLIMYQVKAECGMEIQVLSTGRCRVENEHNVTQFEGTYKQCVEFLHRIGVRLLSEARR